MGEVLGGSAAASRSRYFWHGVRLGWCQGAMAGGLIGTLWFAMDESWWAALFFFAAMVGVIGWVIEKIEWERCHA